MKDAEKYEINKFWLYPVRGVAIALITFLIKFATYFHVRILANDSGSLFYDYPEWYVGTVTSIATLFIYNSVLRIFLTYDRHTGSDFLSEGREPHGFRSEIRRIFSERTQTYESVSLYLSLCVLIAFGAFSDAANIFKGIFPSALCERLFSAALLLPFFVIIDLFARYDIRRLWYRLKEEREEGKLYRPLMLILRSFAVVTVYPIAFPYTPLLVFAFITLMGVFAALIGAFGAPLVGIFLIAVFVVFLIVLKIIRRKAYRRRFFKRIRSLSGDRGYKVSDIDIRNKSGESFNLEREGRVFSVKIITPWSKRRKLFFSSERTAYVLYRIGTKRYNVSLNHTFDYGFDSKGEKIILIMPMPRGVYVTDGRRNRELFFGDRVFDYTIYDPVSILGAIDRDILGVRSGRFE